MKDSTERVRSILKAKYANADLKELSQECPNLSKEEHTKLHTLLQKFESLFDGTLGVWNDAPHDIELKPDATPCHAR